MSPTTSAGISDVGVAAGSLAGAFLGGLLLGMVPEWLLLPGLAAILLLSAVRMWRH